HWQAPPAPIRTASQEGVRAAARPASALLPGRRRRGGARWGRCGSFGFSHLPKDKNPTPSSPSAARAFVEAATRVRGYEESNLVATAWQGRGAPGIKRWHMRSGRTVGVWLRANWGEAWYFYTEAPCRR